MSTDTAPRPNLEAVKDAPVGGQAVLEGVMMRGVSTWAVAVRKPAPGQEIGDVPTGEIAVSSEPLVSWIKKHRLYRLPVGRGVVALGESLSIGFRALGISANAQMPEEEQGIGKGTWTGTVVFAVLFAVGLFFLLPGFLGKIVGGGHESGVTFVVIEKLVRIGIFLGSLWLIARMKDLQ